MKRRPPGTISPPPRRRGAPATHQPTSLNDAEATLSRVRQDRDVLRSAAQTVVATADPACTRCREHADAARYALDQVDGKLVAPSSEERP